jgi:hypothetical protein
MSVCTQAVYDEMVDTFGVSTSSERFRNQFFRAANRVSRDLNYKCWQDIDSVSDLDTDIIADSFMYDVYVSGCRYYLTLNKEWGIDPDTKSRAEYERELAKAQTMYLVDYEPKTRYQEDD